MAFAGPHKGLGGLEEANRSIGKSQKGDPTVGSKDETLDGANGKEDRTNPAATSRSQRIETQGNYKGCLKPALF